MTRPGSREPLARSARGAVSSSSPDPRPPGLSGQRFARTSSRWWLVYLVFAVGLSAVYFALPRFHLQLWTPLGLSSVAATVVGVCRYRPRRALAWWLLAAAEFCFIAGDTTYNLLTQVLHEHNPFPSFGDVFYLLTYVFIAAAIFLLVGGRSSTRDRAVLIDALIITTGLGLLSWVYLIEPNFSADGLTALQRATSVAYPLGDVLVLAMLARLVGRGGARIRSMQLLFIGAAGLIAADVLYGLIQLNGVWAVGGPVDLGWVVFYVAWGCAALHPSMAHLGEVPPRDVSEMGPVRVTVLMSATLIAPGVLLTEALTGAAMHATTIAIFSAALFGLVIARIRLIVAVQQRSAERERTLRSCSESLVGARGVADIYQVALTGVVLLIGPDDLAGAGIFIAAGDDLECVASTGAAPNVGSELWRSIANGGGLDATRRTSVCPLRDDHTVPGMLVVESVTPMNRDQHGALATLAAQVALAVEGANLAADLRQRQSEARFRGILHNTADIIVIVDAHGEIIYATPSMSRILATPTDEIVGSNLAWFLAEDAAAAAGAMFAGFAAQSGQTTTIVDWRLRRRDGTLMAYEVLSNNLLEDPNVGGIVLTMRDVSERRELETQLKHLAFHDSMTGLPNRALFQDRAEHALARTARHRAAVAMLMLDLDDFKIVNDTRGHAAGDELLVGVAQRLRSTLRADATVSRLGGDEFAMLIEDLTDVADAEQVAQRTLQALSAPFLVQGAEITIHASVGLALTGGTHPAVDTAELMRRADVALYAAKDRGKRQAVLYTNDLTTRRVDLLACRADLDRAINAEEFVLLFQPIVAIESGHVLGCEALIRWQHPDRGLVAPVDFVPVAEQTGQIIELGRWVLNQACAQLRTWADAGHDDLRMSVNVSARQLHDTGFLDELRSAMSRHRTNPTHLVLELTESLFALDAPAIGEQIRALRKLGVKIAMDDFGTGYSSLSYLQQFQIDILKIDKSFVDGLHKDNSDSTALVKAIVSLAHSLRLEVVAEGIEHTTQRDQLVSMGCTLGQGYLYSRPLLPPQLSALLTRQRGPV